MNDIIWLSASRNIFYSRGLRNEKFRNTPGTKEGAKLIDGENSERPQGL